MILVACKSRNTNNNTSIVDKTPSAEQNLKAQSLPFLDTVIQLKVFKAQRGFNVPIPNDKAKKAFYKYFKTQGILPRQDVKISQDGVNNKLCVDYDTIYQIKSEMYDGAVVSYWTGTPDLNGHCFQPSRAFIQATTTGYVLSNENFIHSDFAIDSSFGCYIYGYDYDCGGKGVVRRFRITLK